LATLPKLRRIGLVKCQAITNQSILALAHPPRANHPMVSNLERVHLSYCVSLDMNVSLPLWSSSACLFLILTYFPGNPSSDQQLPTPYTFELDRCACIPTG
jgi:hypothetical protein